MLPAETIRIKRDGGTLSAVQIDHFVHGLVSGAWGDAQVAALAMAVLLKGMSRPECVALTRAMTHSGQVLDWRAVAGDRPVLDKHSTGGVGDKVSLVLAPVLAACGALVPMVSGRGLGHTGGTLDKLEALPGYTTQPDSARLQAVLRSAGCAIVGAGASLAPADARLYAIRDVTATVESVALITASILSKKLAAGLQGLVLDVKVGSGAFMPGLDEARALATSLVQVAAGAGLPALALLTDMGQVLGHSAGNALEVAECLALLKGRSGGAGGSGKSGHEGSAAEPRLRALTLALAGELLALGGLAPSADAGAMLAEQALRSGRAAEHFARMVAGLGGPADVLTNALLPTAPCVIDVPAPRAGRLVACDARALGLAIVALGGGRARAGDRVDPRVGLSQVAPLGSWVQAGQPLLRVHAASEDDARRAGAAVLAAFTLADLPCDAARTTPASPVPVLLGKVEATP